jgi:glutathione S-transferase
VSFPGAAPIVLWQIDISHFSEKVRWALAYKRLEHERRTPLPGAHIALAAWLTRGRAATLPLLELDGKRIADSTAIIAALEERFPEPALLPKDPAERRRALELARWFDHELGPYTRRLVFYELRRDPSRMAEVGARAAPALAARLGRAALGYSRAFVALRYRAGSPAAAEHARARIIAGFERLEHELGAEEYLVGGRFTAADLTAASLLYPVALPPQAPSVIDEMPEPYERFRDSLRERRGYGWVQEIFARHRHAASGPATRAGERGPTPAVSG